MFRRYNYIEKEYRHRFGIIALRNKNFFSSWNKNSCKRRVFSFRKYHVPLKKIQTFNCHVFSQLFAWGNLWFNFRVVFLILPLWSPSCFLVETFHLQVISSQFHPGKPLVSMGFPVMKARKFCLILIRRWAGVQRINVAFLIYHI